MFVTPPTVNNSDPALSDEFQASSKTYFLTVYVALVMIAFVFGAITYSLFAYAAMLVSRTIHGQVFERMTRAPVRFFDSTPRGRIVNRFGGDVDCIDLAVPRSIFSLLCVIH